MPDRSDGEHKALEELYEDSDGSTDWRISLARFTASHLERHRLSRGQRREVKDALHADPRIGLAVLESIHKVVHGAY